MEVSREDLEKECKCKDCKYRDFCSNRIYSLIKSRNANFLLKLYALSVTFLLLWILLL